jgi:flagellin
MRIQNNVPAINAHRYYSINQTNATKSMAKLSSGYRINSAADDAAGLAISEKMRAQIRGLTMASKNAQDAISLIQTAEGGMQEIDNMVQRIRELVVYASNDTQDYDGSGSAVQGDRQKIQDEINSLSAEIDSMAERVEFNKKKLINGSLADPTATVAALNASITSLTGKKTALLSANAAIESAYTTAGTTYSAAGAVYQTAIDDFGTAETTFDAAQTTFDAAQAAYDTAKAIYQATGDETAWSTAVSTYDDALTDYTTDKTTYDAAVVDFNTAKTTFDVAQSVYDTATRAYNAVKQARDKANAPVDKIDAQINGLNEMLTSLSSEPAGTELYFQVGANANQKLVMNIGSLKTSTLGIGDGAQDSDKGKENNVINVMEATGADITGLLDTLDKALTTVTTERSKLGAAQNRLEYTMNSLDISAENLTAAEGRIRDVDMAKEMTNFTKQSILFQASTAMLAQANAFPQGVLQLLG